MSEFLSNATWVAESRLQIDVDWLPEGAAAPTRIRINAMAGLQYFEWLVEHGAAIAEPPLLTPQSISDRQFFQQLAVAGIVTQEQALASNAAVIPEPLLAIIEQMPEEQQFAAKMVVSGATTFERSHPMTIAIGEAYGMSAGEIDAFFAAASLL